MRKIYLCLVMLCLGTSISLIAQNTTRWYNYANTMRMRHNGASVLTYAFLFPDSTIIGPSIHNIGDMLDVSSPYFNDPNLHEGELFLDNASTFRLDSISIVFKYNRKMDVTDTLVIEVATNQILGQYDVFGYINASVNDFIGVDTILYRKIPYSYATNSLNLSPKRTYKIPLDSTTFANSTNGVHIIKQAIDSLPNNLPGGYVVSSFSFIPGYTWNDSIPPYDTLANKNNIIFCSSKEVENGPPFYVEGDFNVSYVIPTSVRYNLASAGAWKGEFIPSFEFMKDPANQYRYEHHLINYKVTCLSGCGTVSINELEATDFMNGIKLFQNQPNPANGSTLISYELGESSSVALSIYDITGKKVMTLDEGKKPAGKHSVIINQDQLKSGIYLYSLTGNSGNSLTRKMIITE